VDCNYFFYFQAGEKSLSFTPIYFMEQYPETSLFELQIDPPVQSHLGETARWAKFLGMMGFIGIMLFTLICVVTGIYTINGGRAEKGDTNSTLLGLGIFAVTAVLMFFPSLYLNSFASGMQKALRTNDQEQLISSFRNLKACFRFIGILAILYLGLIILIILFNIFGTVGR
jgi:uncharacterized membrane protein